MTALDHALSLASRGFHVFPIERNGKHPVIKEFQNRATRDEGQIRKWFAGTSCNVGISTSRFGDDKALIVVDIDCKGDKRGDVSLLELELSGSYLPISVEHCTPNNGRHIIYVADQPVRQGVDVLGPGLDIRSSGGYILGPGSEIDGKAYAQINGHGALAEAPRWLVEKLGLPRTKDADRTPVEGVDADRAFQRAAVWLDTQAPLAIEGQGGDQTTYLVAARVKDFGCNEAQALDVMAEWNERCSPPWSQQDLADKVRNAYRYGSERPGCAAPEAAFESVEPPAGEAPEPAHPFGEINRNYAMVKKGCIILHETTDAEGRYVTDHLDIKAFHAWHQNQPFTVGKTTKPISQWWMGWEGRRQYEGVVFAPEQTPDARFFNLWRGFRIQPADTPSHPAVEAFKEHALRNVCNNDYQLYRWLMGYFAHMVQRPWEKPLVALVFKGRKGTGKNALMDRVGYLFGDHYMVADDDRYLLGNFNAHLESSLCLVLDEAAWAGDKKAEGRLKGLITGTHHNIERKGREMYRIRNLTRVVIIGNEDWLVPASQDERRFAVFALGEGRMQDRQFFRDMRVGMEEGGAAHLLRFLLDYDISSIDVNDAPATEALLQQKLHTLPPIAEWWYDCLVHNHIAGADTGSDLPDRVSTNRMRESYARWARNRNIKTRLESEDAFGRELRRMAPSLVKKRKTRSKVEPGDSVNDYVHYGIDRLRTDFDTYMGGPISWPTTIE